MFKYIWTRCQSFCSMICCFKRTGLCYGPLTNTDLDFKWTHHTSQHYLNLWDIRQTQNSTKVNILFRKSQIHNLHEWIHIQLLRRLSNGGSNLHLWNHFLHCWFPLLGVWVNVSNRLHSSACLWAHRSRQAPRLIPSLSCSVSDRLAHTNRLNTFYVTRGVTVTSGKK